MVFLVLPPYVASTEHAYQTDVQQSPATPQFQATRADVEFVIVEIAFRALETLQLVSMAYVYRI